MVLAFVERRLLDGSRLAFLVGLFLAAIPPGAAQAADQLPILGATAELLLPLDTSEFVVDSTTAARTDSCGEPWTVEAPSRLLFAEGSAFATECGIIGLRYPLPQGVRRLQVEFLANRSATRSEQGAVLAQSLTLDRRLLQHFRTAGDDDEPFLTVPLFPQGAPSADFTPFSVLVDVPEGATSLNFTWHYEDRGANSVAQEAPTAGIDTLVGAVDDPAIRLGDQPVEFGHVLESTNVSEGEESVTTTVYGVTTPIVAGSAGPAGLRITLAPSASFAHVVAPGGTLIPADSLTRTVTPTGIIVDLPSSLTAIHGNGTYGIAIETRAPLPPPPAPAEPLVIFALAYLAIVLPAPPGAAALRSTLVFSRRAIGRFRGTARALFWIFGATAIIYAALLAYVFGAERVPVMARLPPDAESSLLLALFVLVAITFVVLAAVPGRYVMRLMQADLEERRRAEAKFRDLLEGAPDPMVIVDANGAILLANAQTERTFGRARVDIVGKPVEELMPERYRGAHPGHRGAFFASPKAREMGSGLELYGLRADGTEFPIEISLSPIQSEDGTLVMAAMRDITERKRVQRELERSNKELEQFAYVASHDLQEPLRTVAGFAQLLEQRYGGTLDDRGRDYVKRTVAGSQRMQQLINDLLAFSRIDNANRPMERVELDRVYAVVMADLEAFLARENADVSAGPLPTVYGDPIQLAQVFSNLIRNAVKYRDPGRRPTVRISAERGGQAWRFCVRDNGIGIAPEYHEKIFIIFQRLAPRTEGDSGTGLGLAITKKIVERHGGRIWVESAPGEGAAFFFTIPDRGERA